MPATTPSTLNWVCNYPDGDDTFASVPSLTGAEQAAQNYDYCSPCPPRTRRRAAYRVRATPV